MINTEYPIDAVVTWVDGNDPAHKAKRAMYGKKDESHIRRFRNSTTEKFCCMNSLDYAAPEDQKLALDWLEERLGLR